MCLLLLLPLLVVQESWPAGCALGLAPGQLQGLPLVLPLLLLLLLLLRPLHHQRLLLLLQVRSRLLVQLLCPCGGRRRLLCPRLQLQAGRGQGQEQLHQPLRLEEPRLGQQAAGQAPAQLHLHLHLLHLPL